MPKFLTAILMCLTVLGCKEEVVVQKSTPTIKGVEYILTDTPNDTTITLTFSGEDNRYFGKVLNNYFGSYEMQDNGHLTLSGAASTMMAGPRDLMQLEQEYLIKLNKVREYKINEEILTLYLTDGQTLIYKKRKQ
ncbi:MAG: META domain-containing protein [Alphaproteobacteria bacterium]|nr:META domain-containing protein [Alphaproteobacteria bacterium]